MDSSPVGVQCTFDYLISCVSIFRLSFSVHGSLSSPLIYSLQPFIVRSSSCCFSFHVSEHHLLHQSVILHSIDMSKLVQFPFFIRCMIFLLLPTLISSFVMSLASLRLGFFDNIASQMPSVYPYLCSSSSTFRKHTMPR